MGEEKRERKFFVVCTGESFCGSFCGVVFCPFVCSYLSFPADDANHGHVMPKRSRFSVQRAVSTSTFGEKYWRCWVRSGSIPVLLVLLHRGSGSWSKLRLGGEHSGGTESTGRSQFNTAHHVYLEHLDTACKAFHHPAVIV